MSVVIMEFKKDKCVICGKIGIWTLSHKFEELNEITKLNRNGKGTQLINMRTALPSFSERLGVKINKEIHYCKTHKDKELIEILMKKVKVL